jgi:uncharacterized protein YukE
MGARPGEWHLLGHDSDPVPASREDVLDVADDLRVRARSAAEMRDTLRGLSQLDGWRGKAAEAFDDKADDVLGDLGKVTDRYNRAADAVRDWAEDVSRARSESEQALRQAEDADTAMRSNPLPPQDGAEPLTPDQEQVKRRHEDATDDMEGARRLLRRTMDTLREAAQRARDWIHKAADIMEDGFWDDAKGWVRDHADMIATIVKVLEVVAMILGAIILVLAIVASAPFALIAAAVVAGVLLLLAHASLVWADTGEATWEDIAWDVVGIAATVVGGKAAMSALKGLKSLVPAMAGRAGASARGASLAQQAGRNMTQLQNALKIRNPANNLARWAGKIQTTAAQQGEAASQAVRNAMRVKPSAVQTFLSQDRQIAQVRAVLNELRRVGPTAGELTQISNISRTTWLGIAANTTGTAIWGKDLPKGVGNVVDFVTSPWTTRRTT